MFKERQLGEVDQELQGLRMRSGEGSAQVHDVTILV